MPKNKIEDLRNLLFETMERLIDPDDDSMDLEKAETVASVAQVIVNSAKVEVEYVKAVGAATAAGTFFRDHDEEPKRITAGGRTPGNPLALVESEIERPSPEELAGTADEQLCLNCKLPTCDENSPDCLVKIKRRAA